MGHDAIRGRMMLISPSSKQSSPVRAPAPLAQRPRLPVLCTGAYPCVVHMRPRERSKLKSRDGFCRAGTPLSRRAISPVYASFSGPKKPPLTWRPSRATTNEQPSGGYPANTIRRCWSRSQSSTEYSSDSRAGCLPGRAARLGRSQKDSLRSWHDTFPDPGQGYRRAINSASVGGRVGNDRPTNSDALAGACVKKVASNNFNAAL
jgi:hypothetical protein